MKKFILIVAICVASGTTIYVAQEASRVAIAYATDLIIAEQYDHYDDMQQHISAVRDVFTDMQEIVTDVQDTRIVTQEQREMIAKKLRHLEELRLQVDREKMYYDEDNSVHMFFPPDGLIVEYFNEAHNTPLYIDRFVRSMEHVTLVTYPTSIQRESLQEQTDLLAAELEKLQRIEELMQ